MPIPHELKLKLRKLGMLKVGDPTCEINPTGCCGSIAPTGIRRNIQVRKQKVKLPAGSVVLGTRCADTPTGTCCETVGAAGLRIVYRKVRIPSKALRDVICRTAAECEPCVDIIICDGEAIGDPMPTQMTLTTWIWNGFGIYQMCHQTVLTNLGGGVWIGSNPAATIDFCLIHPLTPILPVRLSLLPINDFPIIGPTDYGSPATYIAGFRWVLESGSSSEYDPSDYNGFVQMTDQPPTLADESYLDYCATHLPFPITDPEGANRSSDSLYSGRIFYVAIGGTVGSGIYVGVNIRQVGAGWLVAMGVPSLMWPTSGDPGYVLLWASASGSGAGFELSFDISPYVDPSYAPQDGPIKLKSTGFDHSVDFDSSWYAPPMISTIEIDAPYYIAQNGGVAFQYAPLDGSTYEPIYLEERKHAVFSGNPTLVFVCSHDDPSYRQRFEVRAFVSPWPGGINPGPGVGSACGSLIISSTDSGTYQVFMPTSYTDEAPFTYEFSVDFDGIPATISVVS